MTAAPDGPVASTVVFAGTLTTGAPASCTVTLNAAEPPLPAASVAEQVTVVAPSGKSEPEAGEHGAESAPSTRSLAVAAPKETIAPFAPVAATVMLPGAVTTGRVVSSTVTVNEPRAVAPPPAVTAQSPVVAMTRDGKPESGPHVGVGSGSSSGSLALAVNETEVVGPVASVVTLPGRIRVGGVFGGAVTVTRKSALEALPLRSEALQLTVTVTVAVNPDSGAQLTGRSPSTRSLAVGVAYVTVCPAVTVVSSGTPPSAGPVVS